MASAAFPTPLSAPVELFVCGRLCLLGEHSDWAGAYPDPSVLPGKCLVVGTSHAQGLHARVSLDYESPNTFTMVSTDDANVSRTRTFPLDDPEALRREARAGGFWSHVAGTAWTLLHSDEPLDDANATNERTRTSRVVLEGLRRKKAGIRVENYKTTLPIKKGLSSSAAVCVLVARAFSRALDLRLTSLTEARLAYAGERQTPSKCGRMDQAGCAFGPGRLVILHFSGDDVFVEPLREVGCAFHLVVADLNASKDTVAILSDLRRAFRASFGSKGGTPGDLSAPTGEFDPAIGRGLRDLLGTLNHASIAEAVRAIETGDAEALGATLVSAQNNFNRFAGPASPGNLGVAGSPALRAVLRSEKVKPNVLGGKGVGSQGDGSVQFLCRTKEDADAVAEILAREFGTRGAFHLEIPKGKETNRDESRRS
jgi:mevalonate kinase